jgi:hypothetical protein
MATDPLQAALKLTAPEIKAPSAADSPFRAFVKLTGGTILDLRNLLVAVALLIAICAAFGYLKSTSPGAFWSAVGLATLCAVIVTWEVTLLVRNRFRDYRLKAGVSGPCRRSRQITSGSGHTPRRIAHGIAVRTMPKRRSSSGSVTPLHRCFT